MPPCITAPFGPPTGRGLQALYALGPSRGTTSALSDWLFASACCGGGKETPVHRLGVTDMEVRVGKGRRAAWVAGTQAKDFP